MVKWLSGGMKRSLFHLSSFTVPHIAHPAFLVMASYAVYFLNETFGIDPLLAGLLISPPLFLFGLVAYRLYYETFERRGSDAGVRGIAFFFGIAFIIEVLLILQFGVDQRSVTASYIGKAWRIGEMRIPFRLLVAFAVAAALTILLTLYLSRTFMGRAIRAVARPTVSGMSCSLRSSITRSPRAA